MHTYYILMLCMAILAVAVFIALFFFKAGYGYLSGSNWGPKISNRAAWVIMECPAFLFMLLYTLRHAVSGTDTGNSNTTDIKIRFQNADKRFEYGAYLILSNYLK